MSPIMGGLSGCLENFNDMYNAAISTGDIRSIHQALTKPVSKHRHKEPEYWKNKFTKRDTLRKIQKQSRQKNRS